MVDFEKINDYFVSKVCVVNAEILPISTYNKMYLIKHQKQIKYLAYIYSQMIKRILKKHPELSKITLVDYGGGTGLWSVYAKLAGVGRVIYSDINEEACKDAKKIAFASGVFIDEFETADLAHLLEKGYKNRVDVLSGMDVIEHIYNLDDFFKSCAALNDNLMVLQVTGANPHHPLVKRKLTKVQVQCENVGNLNPESGKPADSKQAYREIREEMIKKKFPDFSFGQTIQAVFHTRGFAGDDVIKAIEFYQEHKIWPALPQYKNTCDPVTGNWAERMIPTSGYNNLANLHGFNFSYTMFGYDAFSASGPKKWMATCINVFGFLPSVISRYFLPLYCLVFEKK